MHKLESSEGGRPTNIWRKSFPGRGNSKCKGPGAGLCLVDDLTQELKREDPDSPGTRERRTKGAPKPTSAPSSCKGYWGRRVTRILVTLGKSLSLSGLQFPHL